MSTGILTLMTLKMKTLLHGRWAAFQNMKTAEVGARVNDVYLQSIGGGDQSGQSYGKVVDLLLGIYAEEI